VDGHAGRRRYNRFRQVGDHTGRERGDAVTALGEDGDDQQNASGARLGTGLDGNNGAHRVSGGPGADNVTGGPGRDKLYGNDDKGILDSADGLRDDIVSCGPERYIAFVDRPDIRATVRGTARRYIGSPLPP
jgi:serralysin